MMNYAYPLESLRIDMRGTLLGDSVPDSIGAHGFPTTVHEAAHALRGLPLCIIERLDGEGYELALTGGGMDLSWEICEAFVRLGFLPPVHFCDLPDMGRTLAFKPYEVPADPGPRPTPSAENVARFPRLMRAQVAEWEALRAAHERGVAVAPAVDAAERENVARNRVIVAACAEAVRQHAERAETRRERVTDRLARLAD
jgi:hypothetical protein